MASRLISANPFALLAAAAIVAFGFLLVGRPLNAASTVAVTDLGMLAASLTAALSCWLAARRGPGRRARRSWGLMALGLTSWAIGDAAWAWLELAGGTKPPVPSIADIFYVAMIPLVLLGIVARPALRVRRVTRLALLLDSLIATSALAAVSWTLVLGALFDARAGNPLGEAVAMAYPLGDLSILVALALLALREARTSKATILLMLGWGATAIADSVSYLPWAPTRTYETGDPVGVLWFAGLLAIALAARVDRPLASTVSAVTEPEVGHPWRFLLPSALVACALAVVWLAPLLAARRWPDAAEVSLVVASMLLLARYVLAYHDTILAQQLARERDREREAARLAQQDADRLQGVVLAGREIAHLLGNDIALAVGFVDLLKQSADVPPHLAPMVADVYSGLQRAQKHLILLQRVSHVAIKETPVGPALDLKRSAESEGRSA